MNQTRRLKQSSVFYSDYDRLTLLMLRESERSLLVPRLQERLRMQFRGGSAFRSFSSKSLWLSLIAQTDVDHSLVSRGVYNPTSVLIFLVPHEIQPNHTNTIRWEMVLRTTVVCIT